MNAEKFEALTSALGYSLINTLWQGAVVGLLALVAFRLTRESAPQVKVRAFGWLFTLIFVSWAGTLVYLLTQSSSSTAESEASAAAVSLTAVLMRPIAVESPSPAIEPFLPLIVAAWGLGVGYFSLRGVIGAVALRRFRTRFVTACPHEWRIAVRRIALSLDITRPIKILVSHKVTVPCTFGLFKTVILMPVSAISNLSTTEIEALIAHELAHIKGNDVFFNTLQICAETLLFYHPVVWWLSSQIRTAREQRCDDLAIQTIGDRAAYARALLTMEEVRGNHPNLALAAHGEPTKMKNQNLLKRVQRVLGKNSPEPRNFWLATTVACSASIAAIALVAPRPANAQEAKPSGQTQEAEIKVVADGSTESVNIVLSEDGHKYSVKTADLKPTTKVRVDDNEMEFQDLPQSVQDRLKKAVKGIRIVRGNAVEGRPAAPAAGSRSQDIRVMVDKKGSGEAVLVKLKVDGKTYSFNTTKLTPNSKINVNGKDVKFSSLSSKEQSMIKSAVDGIRVRRTSADRVAPQADSELIIVEGKGIPPIELQAIEGFKIDPKQFKELRAVEGFKIDPKAMEEFLAVDGFKLDPKKFKELRVVEGFKIDPKAFEQIRSVDGFKIDPKALKELQRLEGFRVVQGENGLRILHDLPIIIDKAGKGEAGPRILHDLFVKDKTGVGREVVEGFEISPERIMAEGLREGRGIMLDGRFVELNAENNELLEAQVRELLSPRGQASAAAAERSRSAASANRDAAKRQLVEAQDQLKEAIAELRRAASDRSLPEGARKRLETARKQLEATQAKLKRQASARSASRAIAPAAPAAPATGSSPEPAEAPAAPPIVEHGIDR